MTAYQVIQESFRRSRAYWKHVAAIFVLNLVASPLFLLKPLALKVLIDSGFGNRPMPGFITFFFPAGFEYSFMHVVWIAIALVLVVALLENIYSVCIWMLNTFTGEKLVRKFKSSLFDHIQQLSLSYHDRKGTADSIYRLQHDTSAIRTLIIGNLSPILTSVVTLVSLLVIMFSIHWQFGLLTCCLIPPMALLIRHSTRKLKKGWKEVKADESSAMGVAQEVLTSMRLVKSFGQEKKESARFMNKTNAAMRGQMNVARIGAFFYFRVGMLYAAGTAMFFYFGSMHVQSGEISLGVLTMVLAYLAQLYTPMEKISRNLNEIQSSITSLERVFTLEKERKEVPEAAHPLRIDRAGGEVEFKQVAFSYKPGTPVLKNLSFTVRAGDKVGIIGSSGAGKSTIFNLLMRFYDPHHGTVCLDGFDAKQYLLADYRKQFALVLQESVLFSTTIAENIAYGTEEMDMDKIVEAAKLANAHDFIAALPDGYDTLVGEKGMTLSGGERQRVAIARAFIKDAPILILDEPTSALDIHNEKEIMEAIERLMEHRTTFLITHRTGTLDKCNVILQLRNGELFNLQMENGERGAESGYTAMAANGKERE